MKILDVLHPEAILTDLRSTDKIGVIRELATPLAATTGIDREALVRVLMDRERLGSTGIGGGIGIPHGKLKRVDNLIIGFGLSRKGLDFESMDAKPTHIFFVLITPENSTGLHLKALARISRILKNDMFKQKLINCTTPDDVIRVISEEDEAF